MQIKLNYQEIAQALLEMLQKRSSVPIRLVGFDLKGIRAEEGYHANIEIQFDDVDYTLEVPKVISTAQPATKKHEPENESTTNNFSVKDSKEVSEILALLQDNPAHKHTAEILEMVQAAPQEVKDFFEQYTPFVKLRESYIQDNETINNFVKEEENTQEEFSNEPETEPETVSDVEVTEEVPFDDEPEKPASTLGGLFNNTSSETSTKTKSLFG